MTHVLHVDSSAQTSGSVTRQLGVELLDAWRRREPALTVTYRDLTLAPPALVTERWIAAAYSPEPSSDRSALAESDTLIDELLAADVLLIGAPMYNFGVPAVLKAWVDQVVRIGRTFGYDGPVPVGLVHDKRAIVLGASGGDAAFYEQAGLDHRASYLRAILGFLGITDMQVLTVGSTMTGVPDMTVARDQFATAIAGARTPSQRSPQKDSSNA